MRYGISIVLLVRCLTCLCVTFMLNLFSSGTDGIIDFESRPSATPKSVDGIKSQGVQNILVSSKQAHFLPYLCLIFQI